MGRALRTLTTLTSTTTTATTTKNGVGMVHPGPGTAPTLWASEDAHAHELTRALMQALAALGDALALSATTAVSGAIAGTSAAASGADAANSATASTIATTTTATVHSPPSSPSPLGTLRYHLSELTSYTHQHKDKGLDHHQQQDQGLVQHQDQGLTLSVPELAPVPRRFCGLPTGRGKEMVTILTLLFYRTSKFLQFS